MKPRLPREARGLSLSRLFGIEVNNFDIERILPDVLYLVVSRGRQRGKTPNDARAVAEYLNRLATHPDLTGFSTDNGRRLLDSWVRSAVMSTSRATKRLTDEQIDYLRPLTLAVYKPGFPEVTSRQRNVPTFLYGAMLDAVDEGDRLRAAERLAEIFGKALGAGVRVGPPPDFDPAYDGVTELDIHARLQLAYLDGFEPVLASARRPRDEAWAALPDQAKGIGRRMLAYIEAYASRIPPPALARGLLALSNLELFAYSAKLFAASVTLVRDRAAAPAMLGAVPSAPEIYCDFTGVRAGTSDEMARACVDRDLENLGAYFDAAIWLRSVDRYARRTRLGDDLDAIGPDTPLYLLKLCELADEVRVKQWAQFEHEQIMEETVKAMGEDSRTAVLSYFQARSRAVGDELTATVDLIADAQRGVYLTNLTKWYSKAGGLRLSYGLLSGNVAGKRNWRYVLADDLLMTLVQVAFAERAVGVGDQGRMPLREFLAFLESCYGLLVDRPPTFLDNSAARAASRDNLTAFKRKLRQMGLFDELSDDFSAQYLSLPVAS